MTTKPKAVLLDRFEKSLVALLDDMDKKGNEEKYSLTDRMKLGDRILKLESLKQGIVDKNDGEGFNDD